MKKATGICIGAGILAVLLLACCFIFGFTRGLDAAWTHMITVELNDEFDNAEIEKIVLETGASDCLVQNQVIYNDYQQKYLNGTKALIHFSVPEGTDAAAVFEKIEEELGNRYFLKYDGVLSETAGTLNTKAVLSVWPALVILAAVLVYAAVKYGVKIGLSALMLVVFDVCCFLGVMAVAKIPVTGFTIPAMLLFVGLGLLISINLGAVLKENESKIANKKEALSVSIKQMLPRTCLLCVLSLAALIVLLIMGTSAMKNFALAALIGTVINAVALVALPSFISVFSRAK